VGIGSLIPPRATRYYKTDYRDYVATFCPSNAVSVVW